MDKLNQLTVVEELNNIKKDISLLKKNLLSKNNTSNASTNILANEIVNRSVNNRLNNNSNKPSIEVYSCNRYNNNIIKNNNLKKKLEEDDEEDLLIKKFDENNLLNEHTKLLQETIDFLEYKKKGYMAIMKMKVREKNIKDRSLKYKNKYNHNYKIPYKLLSEKINEYTKIKIENDILLQDLKNKFPGALDIDNIYFNKKAKLN